MENILSVKEMAKVSRVSARNLRYYDEIGLFKASGVLENGYRYYTLDKIEEIHIINYFRHLGIPIKQIKELMDIRDIKGFEKLMLDELDRIHLEMENLKMLEGRIKKRINHIEFFKQIPELNSINISSIGKRRIIKMDKKIERQMDWEYNLHKMEIEHNLPPSVFVGDLGFFVDLKDINRSAESFKGIYLLADDPYYEKAKNFEYLPEGEWLSIYLKGNHKKAYKFYEKILRYAKGKNIVLSDYALERTIMDHIISTNPEDYITEIQIYIIGKNI